MTAAPSRSSDVTSWDEAYDLREGGGKAPEGNGKVEKSRAAPQSHQQDTYRHKGNDFLLPDAGTSEFQQLGGKRALYELIQKNRLPDPSFNTQQLGSLESPYYLSICTVVGPDGVPKHFRSGTFPTRKEAEIYASVPAYEYLEKAIATVAQPRPKTLNQKGRLQELCQKQSLPLPEYDVEQIGTLTSPKFVGVVRVAGRVFKSARFSPNVKEAQHLAALTAFEALSSEYGATLNRPITVNFKGELLALFRKIYRFDPVFQFHDDTGISFNSTWLPKGYVCTLDLPDGSASFKSGVHIKKKDAEAEVCEKAFNFLSEAIDGGPTGQNQTVVHPQGLKVKSGTGFQSGVHITMMEPNPEIKRMLELMGMDQDTPLVYAQDFGDDSGTDVSFPVKMERQSARPKEKKQDGPVNVVQQGAKSPSRGLRPVAQAFCLPLPDQSPSRNPKQPTSPQQSLPSSPPSQPLREDVQLGPKEDPDLERLQVPKRNRKFYRASINLASASEDPEKSGLAQLTPEQIKNQQQVLALYTSFLTHIVQNPHLMGNLPLSAFMPAYLASSLPGASGAILENAILQREKELKGDTGAPDPSSNDGIPLAESSVAVLLDSWEDL